MGRRRVRDGRSCSRNWVSDPKGNGAEVDEVVWSLTGIFALPETMFSSISFLYDIV